MPADRTETLAAVLVGLFDNYRAHVPDVDAIIAAMVRNGLIPGADAIENDHIAFRTLGARHLGLASLEKVFLHYGYERRDRYEFPQKRVWAHWYAPPLDRFPRIFISELRVEDLSAEARAIVHRYTDVVQADPVERVDLDEAAAVLRFLHAALWPTPTWSDYRRLLDESEFAAWVIYNRYYLNHFTVAVHGLPAAFASLHTFNGFLEANGFTLNDSGGKAKVSADGKLLQSSTVAAMVDADFDDGRGGKDRHRIAGSYVEFAERRVLEPFEHLPPDRIGRAQRREGFEAASADRIFESTYTAQTRKRRASGD
jgi:hypothetical protein